MTRSLSAAGRRAIEAVAREHLDRGYHTGAQLAVVDAAAALKILIDRAFVFGFRLIMLICAGLSAASSGFAWRMIGAGGERQSPD